VVALLSKEAVFSESWKALQEKTLQKLGFRRNDWLSSKSEEEPSSELERIILDIFKENDETV
jgi:hypothetical protein